MNYKNLVLSKKEIGRFVSIGLTLSIGISILFYNNLWFSIPVFLIYMSSNSIYKEKIKKKRNQIMLVEFKDLLYSISSSFQTGRNMIEAFKESVEFWEETYDKESFLMVELEYMIRKIELGEEDTVCLKDLGERTGITDIIEFADFYSRAKISGANLVKGISDAASLISDKIQLERDLRLAISAKQFESKIINVAPFVVILFLRITSKSYLEVFLNTTNGHLIATISLLLIFFSYVISERITSIEI